MSAAVDIPSGSRLSTRNTDVLRCPHPTCHYPFPAGLYEQARDLHLDAHSVNEWDGVLLELRDEVKRTRRDADKTIARQEAEIARIEAWCGRSDP